LGSALAKTGVTNALVAVRIVNNANSRNVNASGSLVTFRSLAEITGGRADNGSLNTTRGSIATSYIRADIRGVASKVGV